MFKTLHELIATVWEILMRVQMPWRAGLVVLITATLVYWLLWRPGPWLVANIARLVLLSIRGFVSLLLGIEYAFTRSQRRRGRIPTGSYVIGDMLGKMSDATYTGDKKAKALLAKKKKAVRKVWIAWTIFLAMLPIFLWFSRPFFDQTKFGGYIDRSIIWWNALESWVLTGVWTPSAFAEPLTPKPEEQKPAEPEFKPFKPATASTGATVLIRSIPPGASIMVNDNSIGPAPVIYNAQSPETLKIRFEAPEFETLEVEKAAPARGMTIVEYALVPVNFPFGTWVVQIGDKAGKLELQRGQPGVFQAQLIIEKDAQAMESQIKLRGRYDPVQKVLSLNETENATARLKTILSDDLRNMRGELRFGDSDSTLSFEADWREE